MNTREIFYRLLTGLPPYRPVFFCREDVKSGMNTRDFFSCLLTALPACIFLPGRREVGMITQEIFYRLLTALPPCRPEFFYRIPGLKLKPGSKVNDLDW